MAAGVTKRLWEIEDIVTLLGETGVQTLESLSRFKTKTRRSVSSFQDLSEVFFTTSLISAAARGLRHMNPSIYNSTANQL